MFVTYKRHSCIQSYYYLLLLNSMENIQICLFFNIISLVFVLFILYIYSYYHMSDF